MHDEDLISSEELLELRRILKVISAVPRGLNPHIKEFIHTTLLLQVIQDGGAADGLQVWQAVSGLSLEALITQLDTTLEKIQAAHWNGHQLNMGYYLTLLFIYGLALIERGTKQDYSKARSKFMTMKMEIQKKEDCRNFLSLVYFGCGLLLGTQKRYIGGLLEFQKSKQEIQDNNENWYDIDHIKNEDLPETFQDLLDDYIKKYENHIEQGTICRFPDCERSCESDILKKSKYKGFVHLSCSENCRIYFHKICWEKLKDLKYSGKSDQNFLGGICLKKGCIGDIVKMQKCEEPGVFNNLVSIQSSETLFFFQSWAFTDIISEEIQILATVLWFGDFKKQLEAMAVQWQQKQVQIKEKEKMIAGLNQQISSGNHKVSKLQQEMQTKDSEIRKLKEKLASERSQWEREKNKLEAKAKKCLSKLNVEANRAITAEVCFLQSRRDFGLHQLEQTERECLLQLIRVKNMATRDPESLQLKAAVESWETIVTDVRNKIAFSKTQYNEQIALVKNGFPLNCLPLVQIPPPPPSPDILVKKYWVFQLEGTYLQDDKNPWNSFFLISFRKELTDLLRKLKDANGRSLIGLTFDEIVRRVSQMVEPKRSQSADSIPSSHPQSKPNIDQPPRPAWRPLNPQVPVAWEGTKNLGDEEEPCVICHDNLTPENLSVLACAHKFHPQCIKLWLKQQGTCPTCRLYVVLPEEFPGLPSRHIPKI
uniref:DAZ interacting zinc finger protein 3 n=1 Tax=Monodelphis domestica TaxID=13616 RepID=A0A5F8GXB0_MONDO